jgi:hypothetical protein
MRRFMLIAATLAVLLLGTQQAMAHSYGHGHHGYGGYRGYYGARAYGGYGGYYPGSYGGSGYWGPGVAPAYGYGVPGYGAYPPLGVGIGGRNFGLWLQP